MKPLTLIAIPEVPEDKIHDSILVNDRATGANLAIIFSDGTITPNSEIDFYFESFDTFVLIAKNFYLFFNNIKTQIK